MDCLKLITNFNNAYQAFHLSLESRALFMAIWERHNRTYWRQEWVMYTMDELKIELRAKSKKVIQKTIEELTNYGLISHEKGDKKLDRFSLFFEQKMTQNESKNEQKMTQNESKNESIFEQTLNKKQQKNKQSLTEKTAKNATNFEQEETAVYTSPDTAESLVAVGLDDNQPTEKSSDSLPISNLYIYKDKDIYINKDKDKDKDKDIYLTPLYPPLERGETTQKEKTVEVSEEKPENFSQKNGENLDTNSTDISPKKSKKTNRVRFDDLVNEPELLDALNQFSKFRQEIRKPFTESQREPFVKRLTTLGGTDTARQVAILEQSKCNGWQGIYDLKDKNDGRSKNSRWSQGSRTPKEFESDEKQAEFLREWG